MGGVKGTPKTGGRRTGIPNRKTLDLFQKCEDADFDPFIELIKLARMGEEESTRFQAVKEICQYLYPKRKALEISNSEDVGFKVVIEDYKTRETK